ncbi:MAG: glutamine--fructose-6-phosphate transaminase (isomerizing) [Elusimicrobia bacterium]|nr:glutamine--fructose-6-phosphate transaminase (isomerizing) [Elusimicrobiota bacterium]
MCGIVAYAGTKQAVPFLLEGLKRLEYRGYDSAGVAVVNGGILEVLRSTGKLSNLNNLLDRQPLEGMIGVGHTRWATHGGPSEANAHPHTDCTRKVAVIHNGIIENYLPLKALLLEKGHAFQSATDTEVLSHLIEEELAAVSATCGEAALSGEDLLLRAMQRALKKVRGAYALAVLWSDAPGVVMAAKSDSPLVIGVGDEEHFMASDVPAFLKHTRRVVYMEDGEFAAMRKNACSFFDAQGLKIEKIPKIVDWDTSMAEKGGYRHFMLKEIHEQPKAVENTLRGRLFPLGHATLERETGLTAEYLQFVNQVHIVACGTSWHAGIVGKYLLEKHARIQTQVETASEFRYRRPVLTPNTLVIAISQSGETADTLAAIRLAKQSGAKVLSVCNTVGAAISRCADFDFQTHSGPECGVASTKAFTGQLVALSTLALHLSYARECMSDEEAFEWVDQLKKFPDLVRRALQLEPQVLEIARSFSQVQHCLFIGRGINYPAALEGALKLKEISYIHAEGYPAGEMKHGPLALIDSKMPVVAIATQSEIFEKVLSNIQEAKARGARIIALCTEGEKRLVGMAEHILELPPVSEFLSPALNAIPLQLLAYLIADLRGCDVDQPRNLAKSVTVE